MALDDCIPIELPCKLDSRGNLTVVESNRHIPFSIKRIYFLHNIPAQVCRGGHAHRDLHQLIIPVAGSFDVLLDDGKSHKHYSLNNASEGLYICPMIWRKLLNFSDNAVCLVLASELYDEADYFRDYSAFLQALGTQ